jgi:hypothetical protein
MWIVTCETAAGHLFITSRHIALVLSPDSCEVAIPILSTRDRRDMSRVLTPLLAGDPHVPDDTWRDMSSPRNLHPQPTDLWLKPTYRIWRL